MSGGSRSGCRRSSPCTPLGCIALTKTVHPVAFRHRMPMVIGRSNIVGRPLAQLLMAQNATVTVAHSQDARPAGRCAAAPISLVAAIGRAEMVRGDWIKPGATVIDVGINRLADRRQAPHRRRRRICGSGRGGRRHHAGAGRRRPHDHRLPARQHDPGGVHGSWPSGAGAVTMRFALTSGRGSAR